MSSKKPEIVNMFDGGLVWHLVLRRGHCYAQQWQGNGQRYWFCRGRLHLDHLGGKPFLAMAAVRQRELTLKDSWLMRRSLLVLIFLVGTPAWFFASSEADITGPHPEPVDPPNPQALNGAISAVCSFSWKIRTRTAPGVHFITKGAFFFTPGAPALTTPSKSGHGALCDRTFRNQRQK